MLSLKKVPPPNKQYSDELVQIFEEEYRAVQLGHVEDAILTQSVAGNWSVKKLSEMSRRRGKEWRFLSAATDRSLETQGYAVIEFITALAAHGLILASVDKCVASYKKLEQKRLQDGNVPGVNALIDEALADIRDAHSRTVANFWADIDHIRERR